MKADFDLQVPSYENPFESSESLDDLEKKISDKLRTDGFCVFDFPAVDFEKISKNLINKLTPHFKKESNNGQITPGQRLQDAMHIEEVHKIASNPRIIEILSSVYGRKAFPFQTLNFPSSTEQSAHSDHVHFDSIPHRFMAGVWLALEDITEENGPLFYYLGSHKWPVLYNTEVAHHQVDKTAPHYSRFPAAWEAYAKHYGVEKQYFHAKKGQCLIWSSNLVHGGSAQNNRNCTRWSQVTHYYFDDCAYYTPVLSNPHSGNYHWREIYDLVTKEYKPNRVNGYQVARGRSESWGNWIAGVPNLLAAGGAALFRGFNANDYVKANPDVGKENIHPLKHWLRHGHRENRRLRDE
jgi:hypothetical protein